MKVGTANVRELYFEHQGITLIKGKPTFPAVYNMVLQLKANVVSVPCKLGSGVYRYIGIILSPVTYANIDLINPFIVPTPPRPSTL